MLYRRVILFRRTLLQFAHLLVKVLVKVNLDECSVWFTQLVTVEIDEEGADVVYEFVDPGEMEEGSVDGLWRESVAVANMHAPG